MKLGVFRLAVLMTSMLGVAQVFAADGYWDDKAADVWRSGSGECLHTGFWKSEMATVVGCDGYVEPVAAEPAPVVAAPVPMAIAPAAATVNFAFDRSDLDANATAAIDSLVSEAKSKGNIKAVRVTGHTDRVGTEEYNVGLSLRRAGAVNDYLVQNAGIGAQMIEMSGKGESEPLATCEGMRGAAALECLAPNRRAEIVFDLF